MDTKYHVDFNGFEEYRNAFETKILEFRSELYKTFKTCQNVEWEGPGYDSTIALLNNEISKLDKIPQVLDLFKEFMNQAINDYSQGMEEVKQAFESILNQIRYEKARRGEIVDGI